MVAMQAQILLSESFPARLWPLETMEYSRYGSSMSWWCTNGTTLQKNVRAAAGGRAAAARIADWATLFVTSQRLCDATNEKNNRRSSTNTAKTNASHSSDFAKYSGHSSEIAKFSVSSCFPMPRGNGTPTAKWRVSLVNS